MAETLDAQRIYEQIDSWYARAPSGMNEGEVVRWVQRSAEIPCPHCGDPLWVLRSRLSMDRGFSHLALCQREDCTFQLDD